MDLSALVREARARGASDVHVADGGLAHLRVDGRLQPLSPVPAMAPLLNAVLEGSHRTRLMDEGEAERVMEVEGCRLRLRACRSRSGFALFLRLLPGDPPRLSDLSLPEPARDRLAALAGETAGLILVVGASGSGKTTTAAALVDAINRVGGRHVLTVEDPVEYVHAPLGGPVTQREVGRDTPSFRAALEAALRADPDVVLVGEIRDGETLDLALSMAETGHLVIATLHAASAPGAVDRVIDLFPPDRRDRARETLAATLVAVVHQSLAPRKGGDRVALPAVMVGTSAVKAAIREGRARDLAALMMAGAAQGMITRAQSLDALFEAGIAVDDTRG
jgi:twitching motility protein PilT